MKTKIFTLLLLSVFFACKQKDTEKTNTVDKKKKETPILQTNQTFKNEKKCKSLFVIAEDRSGSTTNHRKLTANDYKMLLEAFQKNNSGQVAVRVIGNPAPQQREFYILKIASKKDYLEMEKADPLLSEKTALKKKNKKIAEENKKIETDNLKQIQKFIQEKITPNIIDYKPYKNKDITNVKDALEHLQTKINEPTFRNYDKIEVLIVSDGIHDASKLKEKLQFKANNKLQLYLIGWKDKSVFDNVQNKANFESIDGFIEYYNETKCN